MRLFLFIALFINTSVALSETLEGFVVSVHDGDTVTLLLANKSQVKIRLAQIDAPESDQAFGQKSKQALATMVFNKNVKVEKETVDKYGRTVGTIFVDSLDANREQIRQGMAWTYRQYLHDQSLIQDEENAKQSKIGLWFDPNPIPPWEYRHSKKGQQQNSPPRNVSTAIEKPSDNQCGAKRYCKEMTSCDEAKVYLSQCGLSRLDGDGDGVPCEKLCNSR
ncbi:thermonuclease family protein [Methylomonas rosea]|uniref:Thermonuclease family protein n=1 Tax=Methylomonas rosea TaxID=2952227 RepID=A0ABT1TYQ9_9GAMM|nr:thermonuclease family protein [Methylomonas sp. WSC-7]MCQ8119907.1 thermonuclease family protein [Methylomonas sp. WSC-7]